MFTAIALGVAAASTISTASIIGGAAVVSTVAAIGLKKHADKVVEHDSQIVEEARSDMLQNRSSQQKKENSKTQNHKVSAMGTLLTEISNSDMKKSDKEICSKYVSSKKDTLLVK